MAVSASARRCAGVLGKGRKVREVPIKGGSLEAIRAWLRCRGDEPGPLVGPVRKGGKVELQPLAPAALSIVITVRPGPAGRRELEVAMTP
jgi:integrase